jgi:hypothetical protein
VAEETFDAYMYQLVENKQRFISQVMTSKTPSRSIEEDGDEFVLDYAQIKAIATGNPLLIEKIGLELEITKLRMLESNFRQIQYGLNNKLALYFPGTAESLKSLVSALKADVRVVMGQGDMPFCAKVNGRNFVERVSAGQALVLNSTANEIQIKGLSGRGDYDAAAGRHCIKIGAANVSVELGNDAAGNIIRIENAVKSLPGRLSAAETKLADMHKEIEKVKLEASAESPHLPAIASKQERLREIDMMLAPPEETVEGVPQKAREAPQKTEKDPLKPFGKPAEAAAKKPERGWEPPPLPPPPLPPKVGLVRSGETDCRTGEASKSYSAQGAEMKDHGHEI